VNKDLKTLARQFQIHNRAENKSDRTIAWYEASIQRFCRFIEEWKEAPSDLDDLNIEQVEFFIVELQTRPSVVRCPFAPAREQYLTPNTINGYVRALRSFSHWLYLSRKTKSWTLERLKPPKTDQNLKNVLTEEELRVIFQSFNPETFLGARNLAILGLFVDGGLRASELTELKIMDCDLQVGFVKVKGKGRKERVVGISDQAILMIEKYLEFRPETDCPNLFVTYQGTELTYNAIQNFFQRLRQRLGFEKLHAHLLRHTSATVHLQNGEDLVALQRQLGHTSIAVTQLYVGRNYGDVRAHQASSPLKTLKLMRGRRHR
jgi:site-specific recombinase XerD